WRRRPHRHRHVHVNGDSHEHVHTHEGPHAHVHDVAGHRITPWALFVIFVLGPCEPLIPLLMFPAATAGLSDVFLVAAAFGAVTIATMLGVTLLLRTGLARLPLGGVERYAHALAGGAILMSGAAMKLFGL
ncbi:MAG: hypothetical protein JSW65_01640, partial [Candidatus Bipolaricaulota bacterium]